MPYTLHFAISFSNPDVLSYASSYETGALKIHLLFLPPHLCKAKDTKKYFP